MMLNELTWTGLLIGNLKRYPEREISIKLVDDTNQELKRVARIVLSVWSEKRSGMAYFIDFHYFEARRLLGEIGEKIRYFQEEGTTENPNDLQVCAIYLTLASGLDEIIEVMELMINS